jgi:bacterioferritin
MTVDAKRQRLLEQLNHALGWEMRALSLYAHYAAYVKGITRLHLKPHFEAEATESLTHAATVRGAIVKLGGVARTDRDPTPIVHTEDFRVMLDEALKTEQTADKAYREILELGGFDAEVRDALEQILFAEERSVEELKQLREG